MKDLRIEQFTEKDIYGTIELLQNVFHKQEYFRIQRDIAWWQWKYQNNIFGKPIIFLAKTDNGHIVGSRIFWPWGLQFQGKTFKAFQPVDTAILPEFRGAGLFRKMTEMALTEAQKQKTDILFNFPNSQSLPGYQKMGWHHVGKMEWFIRVLKPIGTITSLWDKDQLYPHELQKEFLLNVERCESILLNDEEIQNDLIRVSKTRAFYSWRYAQHPYFKYGILTEQTGAISTSLIFGINENKARRELIIMEVIGSSRGLLPVFRKLICLARSWEVDFIVAMNTKDRFMNQQLWKLGFFRTKKKNFAAFPINNGLDEAISNMENWSFFGGMHDSI